MTPAKAHPGHIHVAHLTGSIDPAAGGPAYSIPAMCQALRDVGVTIDLLTLKDPRGGAIRAVRREFEVLGPMKLGHAPAMWTWLSGQAQAGTLDIAHSHNLWQAPSIYPELARRRWGIPHVVSPRGTLTEFSMSIGSRLKAVYWPCLQKPVLQRAALFHVTAESEIEDLRRLGLRQPAAVIPIGIDLPAWIERPAEDSKTILFLGRLHPEKGPMQLLKAWASIQHERLDWKLRFIGPDPVGHLAELQRQVAVDRIARVEFHPAAYDDAKFSALREGSLCVLPSPTENFGVTVAEALAVGVPVIANHGAPWSVLKSAGAGWWIPHGVAPLANALMEATGLDYARRQEMGEVGRDLVGRTLGWKALAEQMSSAYLWILERGERPACVHRD